MIPKTTHNIENDQSKFSTQNRIYIYKKYIIIRPIIFDQHLTYVFHGMIFLTADEVKEVKITYINFIQWILID